MSFKLTWPASEEVVRLGVTGLSRSGKTVFITALVANLLKRGRMPQLTAAADGTIRTAYLQPQPDDTLPRFGFETNMALLTARPPSWPEGTTQISQLRLSLKLQPKGFLSGFKAERTVHIDIIDYPGEWLLDLGMLDASFESWSTRVLKHMDKRPGAAQYLALLKTLDASAPLDEVNAQRLATSFTEHLKASREAGFSDCSPGRFLLPGDLTGSPVLTFAPLPAAKYARGTLGHEFSRRFESYKRNVVRPFFRNHFARIDRQIVLVDVLSAIHSGPPALEDLRQTMADILGAFRPGRNKFLSRIFQGRRIEKILFAATKADHLHSTQHPQLIAVAEALLSQAKDRAEFAGAFTAAMAIASLRSTVEKTVKHEGSDLGVVIGRLQDSGKDAAFYPGELPTGPSELLSPAYSGAQKWLDQDYGIMKFAPQVLNLQPGDGPPHIRVDKAAQFLLGDLL